LAKVKEGSQNTFSQTGAGTFAWMAPGCYFSELSLILKELARGKPLTKAVDVYSFAVIVWEMITSELPWKGNFSKMILNLPISF
jgi:serine/threonine protein kinase